jgi:hypothetical protein
MKLNRIREILLCLVSQGLISPLKIGDLHYITITDYLNAKDYLMNYIDRDTMYFTCLVASKFADKVDDKIYETIKDEQDQE